ncbi:pentatricopeptide repeat-containing protein At3g24000, mitochondrial [Selaginella moellendorffii]|uniref:pentatricopeptide repeat-containing protein At3g24000, mitochondrial n=1 Tax=Selaginella moellendorffii TaxID=88036 RepID=UPI000D1C9264|nr:pentatricopeptide repeat-containing protein At3g24000, mitochondrial [Selaginella moellendorffii]XP_024520629.1 pentatricopeptide repeat-containing protein At3g24000, mitochondrial [Selaginella moellendorffii]|eukprot:XP_024520628.1 pentatricopeptide repeat-containing protein At3g24000, mitochondrial [Selaginella moellendorffii]
MVCGKKACAIPGSAVFSRYLHFGSSIGAKSALRKITAAEEGAQYNLEWLNKVLEGLDRNVIRGRGERDYFLYIVRLCTRLKALVAGRRIHEQLVQMGIAEQLPLAKFIVQMYLSCGSLDEARNLFDLLPSKDVGMWTAVIAAYAKYGRWQEAIKLFETMESRTGPAKATYFAVMKSFASAESLAGARLVHSRIVELGAENDDLVRAALIEMYGRCGSLEEAWSIFSSSVAGDGGPHSVLVWNAIISASFQNGQLKGSLELFWKMRRQGVRPDSLTLATALDTCAASGNLHEGRVVAELVTVYGLQSNDLVNSSLVHMYGKCGSLDDARRVFDGMAHRGPVVWSKMIAAYSEHGHCSEAFVLLKEMESAKMVADASSCVAFLQACGSLLALEAGQEVHGWITMKGLEQDVFVGNALVDMYGKCGSVEEAWAVFDNMKEKNWFSWNFMVEAYCSSGYSTEAIQVFLQMLQEGVKPNAKTFTSVLVACGHAGFIREGILHLVYMSSDYDVVPIAEHYACAVGLLGRSGWVKEAEEYVKKLPDAEAPVWDALVTACRIHGDLDRGRSAAESLLECSPHAARSYAVVAGLYNALARSDDAARVRETMTSKGLTEERVTSSILVGNTTCHEFITADTRHKRIQGIHAELEDLGQRIAKDGYAPDASKLLMHERAEEQRQESLFYHSERLAVGLGAIKIRGDCPLRIIRNFRMCADCHTAIKFMSKAMGRTIILRDGSSQLHRFVDGHCACRDYW